MEPCQNVSNKINWWITKKGFNLVTQLQGMESEVDDSRIYNISIKFWSLD